jgi:phosphatidylinositol-3-phosphatase
MKTVFCCILLPAASGFCAVSVSSPTSSSLSSPVHFVATSTSTCSKGVAAMGIYTAPYVLAYTVSGSSLNTYLKLAPGTYNTVVQEWDNCGGSTKTPVTITVSSFSASSVSVSSPVNSSVSSPVHFIATSSSTCAKGVAAMGIYTAPYALSYSVSGANLNTYLSLAPGTYSTVVQEWDNCGGSTKASVPITVSGTTTPALGGSTSSAVPASSHVFLVLEENHSYSSVIGNSSMPYLNGLVAKYGLATQYYANTHPSIGNYFMLTTGQIITNNDGMCSTITQDNIVRHLLTAGMTWKAYVESLPYAGYTGCDVYPYVKHHNPFAYFSDVANSSEKYNLVPFHGTFTADLTNQRLPQFSFIVPNMLDDAHDGSLSTADSWLKTNIGPLLASPLFQKDGILIIVFDESAGSDTQHGGGHVAAVVIGPKVKAGYKSSTLYQHQNTLKTLMKALGLSSFPGVAGSAPAMTDMF